MATSATVISDPAHREPQGGLHPLEWGCELLGTALLLLGGLSAVCWDFGPNSSVARHIPSHSTRLLITGLLFAGTGSLIAISPMGRRSGAHLNPVVTLAFWLRGNVHRHDLLGYAVSQVAGALVGTAAVVALWGHTATAVTDGATLPGHGLSNWQAAGVEAFMTASLILALLYMTSYHATARWTPLVAWLLIAALVWQGAPYTGTSLNPARSFAPALHAHVLSNYWVYVVGPVAGALIAAFLHEVLPGERPVTAKLFHDPRYPSTFGGTVPAGSRSDSLGP